MIGLRLLYIICMKHIGKHRLLVYFFERQSLRWEGGEGRREKKQKGAGVERSLSSTNSPPKRPQHTVLGRLRPGIPSRSPTGRQGPESLSHQLLPPRRHYQ